MKTTFKYSKIYDELHTTTLRKKFSKELIYKGELKEAELQNWWNKEGKKVIRTIEKTAGLKFKENQICYLVNHMKFTAISHPLTIRITEEDIKPILIHELIHILMEEHKELISKKIEKFKGIEHEVKIHIPVLLIERKTLEILYGKEQFKQQYEKEKELEILDQAWPMVEDLYPQFKKPLINFL